MQEYLEARPRSYETSSRVERMCEEFDRIGRPWLNTNMIVFNYVAYTWFEYRLSSALCSEFKMNRTEWIDWEGTLMLCRKRDQVRGNGAVKMSGSDAGA